MSPGEAVADQFRRLGAVVAHHRRHSAPFDDQLRKAGVPAGHVPGPELLAALPIADKDTLRRLQPPPQSPLQRLGSPRFTRVTGGSTGAPAVVIVDAPASAMSLAAREVCQGWYGIRRGDKQLRLWGRPLDRARRAALAKDQLLNRIRVDSLALDGEAFEQLAARLDAFGPRFVYGYASMILLLCDALARGAAPRHFTRGLLAVVSTSEVLSEDQRRLVADSLGCPVADEYGCSEVDIISFQCPDGGRHVIAPNIILEAVRFGDEPPGYGQAVVTDLNNRAMPVVRYRLGDLLPLEAPSCGCGRGWPCHGPVLGRSQGQYLVLPDGRRVHSQFLVYAIEELVLQGFAIRRFQIVQAADSSLTVTVVPAAGSEVDVRAVEAAILRQTDSAVGARLALTARLGTMEEIEAGRRNKFQHFRTEVRD